MINPDRGDDDPGDSTLGAAEKFTQGGWYIVPLRQRSKHPGSVVGDDWHHQSSRSGAQLAAWYSGTSHGIALHLGRSGALALDVDKPENLPDDLRAFLEEHIRQGHPFQATRRNGDPLRGHFVFATPGRLFSNSTGRLGSGWGEVRGANGIIVTQPSEHEADDGKYEWLQTGPVPVLPEWIADRLVDADATEDAATDAAVERFKADHPSGSNPGLAGVILGKFDEKIESGAGRHPAAMNALYQAALEVHAGLYSSEVFGDLRTRFVALATDSSVPGRTRRKGQAVAEFQGMEAWAVAQALGRDPDELRRDVESRTRVEFGPLDDLWSSRSSLQHVHQAAWARETSPEAVLHATLARLSGMQSARFDVGKGATGLNYFTALVGESGHGKSSANRAGRELITPRPALEFLDGRGVGSGEGLVEMYLGDVREEGERGKGTKQQVARYAYVYVDEGEVFEQLEGRKGATLHTVLRQAFSCEALGQQNASRDTTRHLDAGSYSLGLAAGFQHDKLRALFAGANGGTPQRFVFADTVVPDLPDDDVEWPGPWQPESAPEMWPTHVAGVMRFPDSVVAEEKARRRRVARGAEAQDGLDAHISLIRPRMAALLAILEGRDDVIREDWDLACRLYERSRAVRSRVLSGHRAAEQQAEDEATRREIKRRRVIADAEATEQRWTRVMANGVARRLERDEHPTRRDVLKMISGRERPAADDTEGREVMHRALNAAMAGVESCPPFEFDDDDRAVRPE